ncbi:protein CASC3 [Biomphalaria glabrata]|nr:protein CASC3 [Biomphalaria glabrata]
MSVTAIASVDKGRRRRVLDDEGEDDNNLHLPEATRPSECESEGEVPDIDLSEYESAVDEGGDHEEGSEEGSESGTEDGSGTESESGSETETEGEEYSEDEGLEEERQSGDGEEQPNNDKPDDDEDKKNPAYVPRKGAFYEHDLRQGNEGPEAEQTVEEKPKKKLWQDEGKWAHDRYSDDSQAPKSREELIAIYGYDIRVADKPPEAPPRKPGREKGPRQHRIKDFVPKMAVIDTTEDGTDSVPNLGDDGVILYGGPSPRNLRKSNMRNSDGRRGGRHVIRNDVDSFNNKNQYDNKNGNDITNQTNEMVPKQIDKSEEFPSLVDTVRPANQRNDQYKKQVDLGNQLKNDQKVTHEKVSKPQVPENVRQNDFRDKGFNKIQQSQDSRKDNSRYQQSFRDDRRGGFNNRNSNRERENSNRYQDENWRSSTFEEKDRYYRNEDYKQDFNRKPHFKGNDGQSLKTGNSSDGRGYSNRASRYEQPPRYQQQQSPSDVSLINESREYTNTSYRLPEDKSKQKTTYNSSVSNTSNIVSDGGDGSTSQNVVFSNKENVQTINVTITSTTTEKKSYAKERRAKGSARSMEGASVASHPDMQKFNLSSNVQYQGPPPGTVKIEPNMVAQSSAKRYSSQRQQGLGNQGVFTEPPPIENTSPKLYNPALPPPSYYREHGSGQLPNPTSVQEFSPAMLPPAAAAALPYGLPVSTTVLPMPPNAQGIANPALFQPTAGPPPVLAPSFLPAGMMYAGAPRVPPPGTPAGFPISIAYASPPPPPASVAASVVATQPPPQGTVPQPGIQQGAQHKKVYRGDITYYAPELQQPSRAHQKRPKAAIPIIDPQAVPRQKQKSDQRSTPEKSSQLSHKYVSSPGNGNNAKGNQPSAQTSNAQKVKSPPTSHENKLFKPVEPNVETMTLESESTKKNLSSEADSGIDVTVNNESSSPTPTCDSVLAVHNIGGYDSDLKGSFAEPLQSFKEEVEVVESLTKNVGDVALIDSDKNENFLVNVDHTVVHNSEVSLW